MLSVLGRSLPKLRSQMAVLLSLSSLRTNTPYVNSRHFELVVLMLYRLPNLVCMEGSQIIRYVISRTLPLIHMSSLIFTLLLASTFNTLKISSEMLGLLYLSSVTTLVRMVMIAPAVRRLVQLIYSMHIYLCYMTRMLITV